MPALENRKASTSSASGAIGGRIFLIGFMGSGKSHWGKVLSDKLQIPFFDLDQKIEEKEEKSINEVFEEKGEEYFRLLEKEVLHLLVESHESFVMACGGGTPCFYNNIDYMNQKGTTIWIDCSTTCLVNRLKDEKEKRPLIKDLDDEQLHLYVMRKVGDRRIFYQQAKIILTEDEVSGDSIIDRVSQLN
ncbi:shikimate kinase [Flavisolibacter tropicus]|uniref:Shikimate kinase n=1 Tax=Flavisolibacter tropicus TaxID=1492898 RepID=A0A172U1Z6_9BACT|nr:shikimate kinase [Flavisolibacter tropicus]ANE53340.1 shikimate kinase [Flavisolibacter tropicus]